MRMMMMMKIFRSLTLVLLSTTTFLTDFTNGSCSCEEVRYSEPTQIRMLCKGSMQLTESCNHQKISRIIFNKSRGCLDFTQVTYSDDQLIMQVQDGAQACSCPFLLLHQTKVSGCAREFTRLNKILNGMKMTATQTTPAEQPEHSGESELPSVTATNGSDFTNTTTSTATNGSDFTEQDFKKFY